MGDNISACGGFTDKNESFEISAFSNFVIPDLIGNPEIITN